jgi:hypothetical protein
MADTAFSASLLKTDATVETPLRRLVRRVLRRKGAVFGLVIIALFLVLAIFAPLLTPYDPIAQSWTSVRKPPSLAHWFGTDDVGRDILVRVIYGARASLMAGVISVGIALTIGVPLGLAAGYLGGFLDALISRITDAMLACPFLILAIALAAFLGPSLGNAMIAIGVTTTPIFVRLTRGQVMSVKVEDYIEAARRRQSALAHRAAAHPAEYSAGALGAGDIVDRGGHHCGSGALFPRPRPAAAGALLGQHAQCGATLPRQCTLDGGVARACDLPDRPVLQPRRRWAA